jgi:hypothetical protein
MKNSLVASTVLLVALSASASDPTQPTFSIDFSSPDFINNPGAKITFTRQGGGFYFDNQGVMKEQPLSDTPRIEYDPFLCELQYETLLNTPNCQRRLKGLLIEEQRENFFSYSEDFTSGMWRNLDGLSVKSNDSVPSPRKTPSTTLSLPAKIAANSHPRLSHHITLPDTKPITVSFYVRDVHPARAAKSQIAPPAPFRIHYVDRANRVHTSSGRIDVRRQTFHPGSLRPSKATSTDPFGSIVPITGEWYRVQARLQNPTNRQITVQIELLAEPGYSRNLTIWGAQLEQGRFPTSYILTRGKAATRHEEALSVEPDAGQREFGWYKDDRGTLLVEADSEFLQYNSGAYVVNLNYRTGRQALKIQNNQLGYVLQTASETISTPSLEADKVANNAYWVTLHDREPFKASLGFVNSIAENRIYTRTTVNGGQISFPARDKNGVRERIYPQALPTGLVRIQLGSFPTAEDSASLNGHLRRFQYRDDILSEADHSAVTSLGSKNASYGVGRWKLNPSMSEECNESRESLEARFTLQDSLKQEPHIQSLRTAAMIKVEEAPTPSSTNPASESNVGVTEGYCVFHTDKGPTAWYTGSMWSKDTQLYGYYESSYRVNGYVPPGNLFDPFLNNAFWLLSKSRQVEIDVNEGRLPNLVQASTHLHRDSFKMADGTSSHSTNSRRWFSPLPEGQVATERVYALHWSPQELIWFVDGQIVRRSANFYAHEESQVFFSTAILRGKDAVTESGVPPAALNGRNVRVNYIRTFYYDPN